MTRLSFLRTTLAALAIMVCWAGSFVGGQIPAGDYQNNYPLAMKVNPLIGTGGHGHTYPGASLPFGRVQLSPDRGSDGWDWCSGYHYSDNSIMGFSHTHLDGTGATDYGDFLFMPTAASR